MRRYVLSLAILAAAALVPTLALAGDQEIAQAIVERLQAEKTAGSLKGFNLDLEVEEGTVWLSGRVSSPEQQHLALDIARRVPGVKQVVNDITVDQLAQRGSTRNFFASITNKVKQAVGQGDSSQVENAVGTGIQENPYYAGTPEAQIPAPSAAPLPQQSALPMPQSAMPMPQTAMPMPQQAYYYGRPGLPMAYAPARTIAHQGEVPGPIDPHGAPVTGQPVPMHIPGTAIGMAPARYDHPHMPGYAWPAYASYPNYAAVTYPKQYSPTAWPYIGPFYPYPQVPLGWRKVTLEWDDGWWFLDFKDRRVSKYDGSYH